MKPHQRRFSILRGLWAGLFGLGLVLLALSALPPLSARAAQKQAAPAPDAQTPAARTLDVTTVPAGQQVRVLQVDLDAAVTPALEDLLRDALRRAETGGYRLLLVRLDTPGGLLETTRNMIKLVLNSPLPVLVWVGPRGAHAASAGVFLVAASAVAGMAPQTNLGSASPVGTGGEDLDKTMGAKVKADLESMVRGLAEAHGRNVDWYVAAVERSVSITAQQAVLERVVEYLAEDPVDFLAQAGARGVPTSAGQLRFDRDQIVIEAYRPGFRNAFLSWLLHPQVAYFLLLGGLAGLFFELTTPGAVFPGVFGGLCLILALYALSVLPTSAAGLALILLGLVLFWLEVKITSYGMLSVAAIAALFIGSVILFEPGPGMPGLPLSTVIVTVLGLSAGLMALVFLVVRSQRSRHALGLEAMLGLTGDVREWDGRTGVVLMRGELWQARSATPLALAPGAAVTVTGLDGLTLIIAPAQPANN